MLTNMTHIISQNIKLMQSIHRFIDKGS